MTELGHSAAPVVGALLLPPTTDHFDHAKMTPFLLPVPFEDLRVHHAHGDQLLVALDPSCSFQL